ncbi:hypothetical protein PTTG_10024 [Puccinia triticina 1-1 BBBD Race 1]|uniref:Uncharacterized protein n=1 Tax=Puccinia triticina (isolate 1-1 / race 1 (BBBD)) TaxID=630390 RepID=A0A180GU93_PUCT1|nr:hypothetical protein PTTG_10024 [Puccinia triticina 1-1 BBBD Race 1]
MAKRASEKGQAGQALIFYQICAGLGGTVTGGQPINPTDAITNNQQLPNLDLASIIKAPTSLPPQEPRQAHQKADPPLLIPGFTVPTPNQHNSSRVRDYDEMAGVPQQAGTAVIFDDSAIPTNDELGFTPFFERRLIKFRAPLPLTIFNKAWQDKAILHTAEKRVKSDNGDTNRYTGYPYPNKYLQTYQEWSINHQGFLAAVRRIPSHANLAVWLVAHKQNADVIIWREGFMTALRYNIHVRNNALTHWVALPNGTLSVANFLLLRKEILLTVHAKAIRFGETDFPDNPYAAGACRFGWDPTTGQPPVKKEDQSAKTPLHLQHQSAKNGPKPGTDTPKGPSGSAQPQRQGGYKGSRWS